ncbi:hypothetical protein [Paenibacillus sp. FSL L8-0494]|uniref:hypothetical protein n=1 Tax=Paenibacillus sp. FSL L8-0494 TaxID=2975352 RepID=UPI0030F7AA41
MELIDIPSYMRKEVEELVKLYTITIEEAWRYCLMGGFDHAKKLLDFRAKMRSSLIGMIYSEESLNSAVRRFNNQLWEQKNKKEGLGQFINREG